MTPLTWVILVIAIIAVALTAFALMQARTRKLKSKFGPEYDRLVRERGSALTAERELERREKRVENFQIRPLSHEERDQFAHDWRIVQEKFVDDPRVAVADADRVVHRTMKTRGY